MPTTGPEQNRAAVLTGAGASHVRDAVDRRILAGVHDGTGAIIDSQAQVGGWPDLAPGTPWIDSDGDGLPDAWETAHGLDPYAPADGASDADGDGFTALDDWLDSLATAETD